MITPDVQARPINHRKPVPLAANTFAIVCLDSVAGLEPRRYTCVADMLADGWAGESHPSAPRYTDAVGTAEVVFAGPKPPAIVLVSIDPREGWTAALSYARMLAPFWGVMLSPAVLAWPSSRPWHPDFVGDFSRAVVLLSCVLFTSRDLIGYVSADQVARTVLLDSVDPLAIAKWIGVMGGHFPASRTWAGASFGCELDRPRSQVEAAKLIAEGRNVMLPGLGKRPCVRGGVTMDGTPIERVQLEDAWKQAIDDAVLDATCDNEHGKRSQLTADAEGFALLQAKVRHTLAVFEDLHHVTTATRVAVGLTDTCDVCVTASACTRGGLGETGLAYSRLSPGPELTHTLLVSR